MPKEARASLEKARQLVHLTGKVNFPCSRLAGAPVPQDRGKRFNQRFLIRMEPAAPYAAGSFSARRKPDSETWNEG